MDAADRLERVARTLETRGDTALAEEIRAALAIDSRAAAPDLITTGDAASLLGIRSRNTVKRWAREGLLDGYRLGGRVMVTRESVERLRATPTLAHQQQYEREID